MYFVTMETERFSWIAFDYTPEGAFATMGRTWKRHCKQYGVEMGWARAAEFYGVTPESARFFRTGDGFRDSELIQSLDTPPVDLEPCPNHGGSFDCSPFCELCTGNQEIERVNK